MYPIMVTFVKMFLSSGRPWDRIIMGNEGSIKFIITARSDVRILVPGVGYDVQILVPGIGYTDLIQIMHAV